MKRQSIIEYGEPLQETSAPIPRPSGREVILKVRHCGVCHSDIHLQDGYFELGGGKQLDVRGGRELPFTLGHEIEGTVISVGSEAKGISVGDRRVIYPFIGCGECPTCKAGQEHICDKPRQIGIQVDGGYATHLVVPDARYLLSYDGIDPHLAGCYM